MNSGNSGSNGRSSGTYVSTASMPRAASVRQVAYLSLQTSVVASGEIATRTPASVNWFTCSANTLNSSSIVGTTSPMRSTWQISAMTARYIGSVESGTGCALSPAYTAGDNGLTSATTTRPPPVARTARWNARTSGTRRDPAVTSTLSDTVRLRLQVLHTNGFTCGQGTCEATATHHVQACRRDAGCRTQRNQVVGGERLARRKRSSGAQRAPARR